MRQARPAKFEVSQTKGDLGRRQHRDFTVWHQLTYASDRLRKAFPSYRFIRAIQESGGDISAISTVNFTQRLISLSKLVDLPLRGRAVQMCHTLSRERRSTSGQEKFEAFDEHPSVLCLSECVQPENTECKRSID